MSSETLRRWRESRGWDVPRMARELRKAARDADQDVAAHHGLVKMIPQWEQGHRAPRERYRLLYLQIFHDAIGDPAHGLATGTDLAVRISEARARAARLPSHAQITALEAAALARPGMAMTPAQIRALAAEAITHLHAAAVSLAELSVLLGNGGDEGGEGEGEP